MTLFSPKYSLCTLNPLPGVRDGRYAKTYRRGYLVLVCCITLFLSSSPLKAQDNITLHVNPEKTLEHISPDFIGLGYETSAVAQPGFFDPENKKMVRLYRNLSTHGLIRIGGIISDHTEYRPKGTPAPRTQKEVTVINRKNLADLGAFARATGWKVMWGLNLETGTKSEAVEEALAVDETIGRRLHSFEIGNEVDLQKRFSNDYKAYYEAYLDFKKAIRKQLPRAPFSGPDAAVKVDWVDNFAQTQADDIKLLTKHYYRGGGRDPKSTIEKMLLPDMNWKKQLERLNRISRRSNVPYRINEVNSFYGGGRKGVSDTFASALWCLDYMYLLASNGSNGINIETDVNQLGWISHYSPIVHDPSGHISIRPEYYGMLAFAMTGGGDLVKLTMSGTGINLTAYATKNDSKSVWITVINKDLAEDADLDIMLPEGYGDIRAYRLEAPSAESKQGITLADARVSEDGEWTPGSSPEIPAEGDGFAHVAVAHTSAVLLCLKHE